MVRPGDYGDQYPSDQGDTSPTSPIDGLAERSYRVGRKNNIPDLKDLRSVFDPVEEGYIPNEHVRTTWIGTIKEYIGTTDYQQSYSVYLQTGETVTAVTIHEEDLQWYEPGDIAVVVATEGADSYAFVGTPQHKHLNFWVKLLGPLGAAGTFTDTAVGYLYYFDEETLIWTTAQTQVQVKNNSPNTWTTDEDVQVRHLHDGSIQDSLYFEPIVGSVTTVITGYTTGVVTTGTGTFTINGITVIAGNDPRPAPVTAAQAVTVNNTFDQAYETTEKVIVFQNKSGGFETEKVGAGMTLIRFELTQDMALSDTVKLARAVDASGNLVTPEETFYVTDESRQFTGLATYTDGDAGATVHNGYRGYAYKYIDDYASGKPGYRIVSMEGHALLIPVELYTSVSGSTVGVTILESTSYPYSGTNFSGRMPRTEGDTFDFTAYDTLDIADGAVSDEKWIVAYNPTNDRYELMSPIGEPFMVIKGTPSASVTSLGDFTLGGLEIVQGRLPTTASVNVVNEPPIFWTTGKGDVFARWDKTKQEWTTADAGNFLFHLKGIGSYETDKKMAIWTNEDDDPEWTELISNQEVVEDYDHTNKRFDKKEITVWESDPLTATDLPTSTC